MLEVKLQSRKNEQVNLKRTQDVQRRREEEDLQRNYAKLDQIRAEVKRHRVSLAFTEENMTKFENLNELKGELNQLISRQDNLESEAKSLRTIKESQSKHLDSIHEVKNYT